MPGKGRRKKRRHKASHGMISFTDLSKQISTLWRNIDRDTKMFCTEVSDIGMQKYQKEKHDRKNQEKKEKFGEVSSQVSSNDDTTSPAFGFHEVRGRILAQVDIDDDDIIDMYMRSENTVAVQVGTFCQMNW